MYRKIFGAISIYILMYHKIEQLLHSALKFMQIQTIWIVDKNLICDEILTHQHPLGVFVSASWGAFSTFYKQTHTRTIATIFVKWHGLFSKRGEKSPRKVKCPQKQIPPFYIISLTDYLVVEGDIYLLQSDIPAYRHRQATSGFDDEFTGRDEGFLPVHHNQNSHKVRPLARFEFFEKMNRARTCKALGDP